MRLGCRRRRLQVGHAGEIKKLQHVRLSCVTPVQVWQAEALLHQLQDGGVIHGCMGDIVRLGKRRHDNEGHAKAGAGEVSRRITGLKVFRRDAVRIGHVLDRGIRGVVDPQPAVVSGDPARLRQLVMILVDNAIRHSPKDGQVGVAVRALGGGASLMVGANIRNETRILTTAITLETGRGDFARAIALGLILLALAFLVNVALHFGRAGTAAGPTA